MKQCKWTLGLIGVLLIIIAILAYRFTAGDVQPSDDGRVAVRLTKDERNALLKEMRQWLRSSQGILQAASEKDFEAVAKAARASGMAAEEGTPGSLFRKLPLEMKTLGFDTRARFDEIAADTEKNRDPQRVAQKLSEAMNNCIACHEAYRFAEADQ